MCQCDLHLKNTQKDMGKIMAQKFKYPSKYISCEYQKWDYCPKNKQKIKNKFK